MTVSEFRRTIRAQLNKVEQGGVVYIKRYDKTFEVRLVK